MQDITNERELIERARHEPEAFGEIFERYYDAIFGYALKRTGSVTLAEDVVAETFLKAFDKLWQFKWQGVPFSAWLYRIAGNEINMHFRKRDHGNPSLEMTLEEDASSEPADPTDLREELMEAEEKYARDLFGKRAAKLISEMPSHYAEALSLRYLEERSVTEVAEILKKPEGTIKSLLSRGIGRLRELIEAQPDVVSGILGNKESEQHI